MSETKKGAAPLPPIPGLFTRAVKENEVNTEERNGIVAAKGKISDELITIKVVLPDQSVDDIDIVPGMSLMDLRTKLCAKYNLQVNSYRLEPVDSYGRLIYPTQSITVSSASAVRLKLRTKETTEVTLPRVVEPTVLLTIKTSQSNQHALRVRPNIPLSELKLQIMERAGMKIEVFKHLELRHPEQVTTPLDLSHTLKEHNVREVFIADKRDVPMSDDDAVATLDFPRHGGLSAAADESQQHSMVETKDVGYEVEELQAEENFSEMHPLPEENTPISPTTEEDTRDVLDDTENLFTVPKNFDIYDTDKDDYALVEAKALEMIRQFQLAEAGLAETAEDRREDSGPPTFPETLSSMGPSTASISGERKQEIPEEPAEMNEEKTLQEIEDLKEQIKLVKQQKAQKEAEKEYAKQNPYKIVPETNPASLPSLLQNTKLKTFTYVPNQRPKVYEDYETAPDAVINLSQGGEIKGIGVISGRNNGGQSLDAVSARWKNNSQASQISQLEIPNTNVVNEIVETKLAPFVETRKPPSPVAQPKPLDSPPNTAKDGRGEPASSVMIERPALMASPPKSSAQNSTSGKKSTLPNYYSRLLGKEAITAAEDPDLINGLSPNSSTADKPKLPSFVKTLNIMLNSPPIESLSKRPEKISHSQEVKFANLHLTSPPGDFTSPSSENRTADFPPDSMPQDYQPVARANSTYGVSSPVCSSLSANFVEISSAKPFGSKAGASSPQFRPMSEAFKSRKAGRANGP